MPTRRRAAVPPDAPAASPPAGQPPAAMPRGCSNFRLRQADRVVSRFYDSHLLPRTGLKTSQYSLLSHIAALAPVRPAVLAQHMGLEPSTLTRNLQPLVTQGWVAVGPGTDARSRLLTLTPDGLAKRAEAQRAWKAAQLAFNERLGAERVAQLHALLDDCVQRIGQPLPPDDSALPPEPDLDADTAANPAATPEPAPRQRADAPENDHA